MGGLTPPHPLAYALAVNFQDASLDILVHATFMWIAIIWCKRPAEQRLHWERKEKRMPGQSIRSSIVKSLSEAFFGLMGWSEVKFGTILDNWLKTEWTR